MDRFDEILGEMDFNFWGSGEHGLPPEAAAKLIGKDGVFFLDVRTREEAALVALPFALNIPVNEMPSRLGEVPRDKLVIVFCSSIFRGSMVYGYLLHKGYDQVKGLIGSIEDLVACLKPGPLYKRAQA